MASMRTLVLELSRRWKPTNVVAQMERFQDNFDQLIEALQKVKFLWENPVGSFNFKKKYLNLVYVQKTAENK